MKTTLMKIAVVVTAIFSICSIAGCQTTGDALDGPRGEGVPVLRVDTIQVIAVTSNTVTLRTVSTVPNPCHYLHSVDKSVEDDRANVQILTTIDPDIFCIEILGTLETNITLNRRGLDHLRVTFPGQIADIDTTLTF